MRRAADIGDTGPSPVAFDDDADTVLGQRAAVAGQEQIGVTGDGRLRAINIDVLPQDFNQRGPDRDIALFVSFTQYFDLAAVEIDVIQGNTSGFGAAHPIIYKQGDEGIVAVAVRSGGVDDGEQVYLLLLGEGGNHFLGRLGDFDPGERVMGKGGLLQQIEDEVPQFVRTDVPHVPGEVMNHQKLVQVTNGCQIDGDLVGALTF